VYRFTIRRNDQPPDYDYPIYYPPEDFIKALMSMRTYSVRGIKLSTGDVLRFARLGDVFYMDYMNTHLSFTPY
jgi:hypothetical protein